MEFPPHSHDMAEAIEQLHRRYGVMEADLLQIIDELAQAGFSDRRWAAIARTHVEEAFMAMHRALRDYPGSDPENYGKTPHAEPLPKQFTPRVGDAERPSIEWKDASGGSD